MDGKTYELRFDGSCWPNPGGRAGYGWVLFVHDPENHDEPVVIAEGCGPVIPAAGGTTTNNLAEWSGLRAGLEWMRCLRMAVGRLLIRGDSQLVIEQLTDGMKCKKPHLRVYRDACRELLRSLPYGWEAAWVPRAENSHADRLSVIHGNEYRPVPVEAVEPHRPLGADPLSVAIQRAKNAAITFPGVPFVFQFEGSHRIILTAAYLMELQHDDRLEFFSFRARAIGEQLDLHHRTVEKIIRGMYRNGLIKMDADRVDQNSGESFAIRYTGPRPDESGSAAS